MMATGLIGALRITLGIDASDFEKGTSKARAEMRGFQRDFRRMGNQWQSLGKNMMQWVTLPILAAGAGVMKLAGDFETGMNQVKIATGASNKELATMRDLARDIGAATTKSASESAAGMEMLAKAGMRTTDIINGGARAVVALAEAGGGGMEQSAAAITDVFQQFDKNTKDLPTIINRITGAVNESKFSFDDFTYGMGMAGGVAGSAGVAFEDFTTALAGTSSMFASGSDAGTSLKVFLMRLVPDTKKAREAMEAFGFSAFDAQGQMKPLRQIAEDLQTKFGHLSEMERAGLFRSMFGQDAIRTAVGLMKMGAEGWDDMNARIAATDASAQAAARMKGFNAEMERLKGAIENLAIAIADSGMLEAITGLITSIASWIDWLSKANPELLKWGTIIAGVAAALGPLVFAIGGLIKGIGMMLPLLVKLAPAFGLLTTVMRMVGVAAVFLSKALIAGLFAHPIIAGAALLIGGIYLAWKNWDRIGPIVANMVSKVNEWFAKLNFNKLKSDIEKAKGWFKSMYDDVVGGSYIPDMVNEIGEHIQRLEALMVEPIKDKTERAKAAFRDMQSGVQNLLARLFPEEVAWRKFQEEMRILEEDARKLGLTADQTAAAIARLRDEYDKSKEPFVLPWEKDKRKPEDHTAVGWDYDVNAPEDVKEAAEDANEEVLEDTQKTTLKMAEAWAEMARDAVGSIRGMVQSIKSGDIWGAIQGFLDLVGQVLGMLGGQKGGAQRVYSTGGPIQIPGLPGFAEGGGFTVGGSGGRDTKLVRFMATPGEHVNITKGERNTRDGSTNLFDLRGAVLTQDLLDQMNRLSDGAATRGAVGGASLAAHHLRRARKGALVG
jgi:TP901 family phage tail tape measure protein